IVSTSGAPAVGVRVAAVIRYALANAGDTVRLTPAPPGLPVERVPSVALSVAVSALYATSAPPPLPVATPFVNVSVSLVPWLTAAPPLSVTVGTEVPFGAVPRPKNVRA